MLGIAITSVIMVVFVKPRVSAWRLCAAAESAYYRRLANQNREAASLLLVTKSEIRQKYCLGLAHAKNAESQLLRWEPPGRGFTFEPPAPRFPMKGIRLVRFTTRQLLNGLVEWYWYERRIMETPARHRNAERLEAQANQYSLMSSGKIPLSPDAVLAVAEATKAIEGERTQLLLRATEYDAMSISFWKWWSPATWKRVSEWQDEVEKINGVGKE